MHPPRRVALHLDARRAGDRADLPRPGDAVRLDVEVRREAVVTLAPRREADVRADARDAERARRVAVEVVADHVPDAFVEPQRVRVEPSLGLAVPARRPVPELDRALLRDRGLELREPRRELGRVVRGGDAHPLRGRGRRMAEARPAEREVLERQPEWLGVGELALQRVERGLERRELVLVELELVEEVVLGAEGVELLARELVALGGERDPERGQLGPIGVEATGERLVGHLRVPLDVSLDVARGERPTLGHEEGDERELTDQLVGVVGHQAAPYRRAAFADARESASRRGSAEATSGSEEPVYAAARAGSVVRSRCWCDGQ